MSIPVFLERLKVNGYKLTPQRKQILETLLSLGARASARDVHRMIRQKTPSVSLDTVYRNLRLLVEIGLVHQISVQSGAVFELADEQRHHHHLVCVDCEKIICIPYCPESQSYKCHAEAAGFSVLGHTFEIYGRCAKCRET